MLTALEKVIAPDCGTGNAIGIFALYGVGVGVGIGVGVGVAEGAGVGIDVGTGVGDGTVGGFTITGPSDFHKSFLPDLTH